LRGGQRSDRRAAWTRGCASHTRTPFPWSDIMAPAESEFLHALTSSGEMNAEAILNYYKRHFTSGNATPHIASWFRAMEGAPHLSICNPETIFIIPMPHDLPPPDGGLFYPQRRTAAGAAGLQPTVDQGPVALGHARRSLRHPKHLPRMIARHRKAMARDMIGHRQAIF